MSLHGSSLPGASAGSRLPAIAAHVPSEGSERCDLALIVGDALGTIGHQVWSHVEQRHQHKGSLEHPWVGYLEVGFIDLLAVHPQHVDVEGARSPAFDPFAAGLILPSPSLIK